MSAQLHATALATAGLGLPSLMWGLDRIKVDIPTPIIAMVLIASGCCLLLSLLIWGHLLFKRLNWEIWLPNYSRRIPLHEAARRAYEAVEKAGVVDVVFSPITTAETKLNHFKLLFVVDPETEVFGVRPPSTQSLLIPKAAIDHLYPSDGEVSELSTSLPLDDPTYVNVTVRRKDLRRVISGYISEAKQHAK